MHECPEDAGDAQTSRTGSPAPYPDDAESQSDTGSPVSYGLQRLHGISQPPSYTHESRLVNG